MIRTIGDYLYILHHEKAWLELQHQKRMALLYSLGIITAVGLAVILFLTGCAGGSGGYYPYVAQQDYRTQYQPAYVPQPIQMPQNVFGSPGSSQTNPIYIAPGREAGFPGGFH